MTQLVGVAMIATGVAIAVVFGGGLVLFLWTDVANVMRGSAQNLSLMQTVVVGPIVGGVPALLGVVLARRGWRRLRPQPEPPEPDDLEDAP
ncbi:MAG TPA: hypothetical protein VF495_26990 [Phenylobacterium sp.]